MNTLLETLHEIKRRFPGASYVTSFRIQGTPWTIDGVIAALKKDIRTGNVTEVVKRSPAYWIKEQDNEIQVWGGDYDGPMLVFVRPLEIRGRRSLR